MTLRDYFIAQIKHEQTDYVPYEFRLDWGAHQKLTQHFGSNEWTLDLHYPLTGGPGFFDSWDTMKRIDPDNPTKTMDAYGCIWTQGDELWHLDQCAMHGIDPRDYKWPTLEDFVSAEKDQRMQAWIDSLNSDRFSTINLGAGHWEIIWRLLGVEDALCTTVEDPDLFDYLVENLDNLFHQFMDHYIDTPVDSFWISDDWCDQRSCMFGVETWRKHFKPRLEKLYKKAHDAGKYVIQHVCGNVDPLLPDLVEIGLDILESVQSEAMDIYTMKKLYGDKITFFGAFGVQNTVHFGTPDQVKDEIRKTRRELSKGGGLILAPAKPIPRSVPIENLVAAYEAFKEENYKFSN